MANYNWRVTNGDLGLAADWLDTSSGMSTVAPGPSDTANFSSTGGTLTGGVTTLSTSFRAGASAPWLLAGQDTTGSVFIDTALNITTGGKLAVTNGLITVGSAAGTAGLLTISAGGTVVSTQAPSTSSVLRVANFAASGSVAASSGSVVVQGAGAMLDLGGSGGSIASNGTGSLSVLAGGTARFGTFDPNALSALNVSRSGGTGTVMVDGAGSLLTVARGITFGQQGSAHVTISNSGTLAETGTDGADYITIGQGGYTGFTVYGGTSDVTVSSGGTLSSASGLISVGRNIGGNGTLNVMAGGTVRSTAAATVTTFTLGIGTTAASGTDPASTGAVTVSGAGALLDLGQNGASVGLAGTGSLTVSNGGKALFKTTDSTTLGALAAARNPGSVGTVTVTGAGSSITAAGFVSVGRAGTGTLLVDQGGSFTGGSPIVADGIGPNAAAPVLIGDGTPNVNSVTGLPNSPLYFGGTASARVVNGSTLHSLGNLDVGRRGSTGSLLIDSGSTVTADTETLIGSSTDRPGAVGTLTVQGGAQLKTGANVVTAAAGLGIGTDAGNTGTVTVTGTGSRIDSGSTRVTVGNSGGTGTLNVLAGASVTSGAGYADTEAAFSVASRAASTGTVVINGAGSSLVAAGQAVIGGNNSGPGAAVGGTGTVSIASGGLFRASSLTSFVAGTLNVDTTGVAVIGSSAGIAGRLTIDAGAGVSGAGVIHATLRDNGSVVATGGTLSIDAVDSAGTGALGVNGGTLVLGSAGGQALQFTGAGTIRLGGLTGSGTVTGFTAGDALDFAAGLTPTLAGNVLTVRSGTTVLGTETFTGLAPATTLAISADGTGGQQVTAGNALFDPVFYLARNPDVKAAGVDPLQHFLSTGYKEGRDPNALFSIKYYLANSPDVAAAGLNPLLHFETSGYLEGRNPSAAFSVSDYLAANPDIKAAGLNPLVHYLTSGRAEGRAAFGVGPAPEPLFDATYYYARNPDVRAAGLDAYSHYIANGYKEGRAPDAFFDAKYYLTQNPDVAKAGIEPLAHFLANGYLEGREPSLLFSDAKYLAANPDVKAAGINPLAHYIASGRGEGRAAFLSGGTAAADPLVNAAYYDPQLGATLIPTGTAAAQQAAASYAAIGWQKGLNPDAFFDTNYYLSHNPDVAAAHINPLLHFEVNGWREGRDPSAAFSDSKYLAAYADVKAAGIDPLLHYLTSGQAEGRTAFTV